MNDRATERHRDHRDFNYWFILAVVFCLVFAFAVYAAGRASQWPKVRAAHLKTHPRCAVCDGVIKLEVHHIIPVHIKPEMELDPNNLITLCEAKKYGVNCHLFFGHLGNYKRFNPFVARDADEWHTKLKNEDLILKIERNEK